jgi:hypothetical protein
MHICDNRSLNYSYNEKCFRQNLLRKPKERFWVNPPPPHHVVYEIMWKNMEKPDWPQMEIYAAENFEMHAG